MSQLKKRVHLFNCDNTYKLEPVEKLLDQFSIHVERVEKHSFRLAQMSENVEKIPTLEMNMAFFVVHAYESRLSINEDNSGIGYAKIYRALLQATGGDVIVVIGGDDNYEGNGEENREVISRWAKRKVSSQFSEEYLDGRKGFIFSWNKQHRAIHEQALLHHFDPNKKGQKFEYQQQSPNQQTKPEIQSPGLQNPQKTDKSLLRNNEATSELTAVEVRQADSHRDGDSCSARSGRDREGIEPSFSNERDAQGGGQDYLQRNLSEEKSTPTQNTQQLVRASQFSVKSPPIVLLRGFARYGKAPDRIGDLQIWDPGFKVPDDIQERLLKKHRNTPLIGVIVMKHSDGSIECCTDPNLKELSLDGEVQLAADEKLVFKTRVYNGVVSFEDVAVQFKYGNKCIPQHIIDGFRAIDNKPTGDLYIISNDSDNFRCVVIGKNNFKKVIRTVKENSLFSRWKKP
ncbi:uncharacterized protein LOC111341875 [Stylophora pistillata]|uniref:uncharacterized protein LOC111341875 n=1 Tax=Stylophora pistillata TaxID=50429 RepID=UPI000C03C73B|nr:uncharacterized protein LOC111341875 [Stylophora pistillata]